jgi:ribosome assembly protein RRB1
MAPGSSSKKKAAGADPAARKGKRRAEDDLSPAAAAAEPDTELVFEDPYGDEFETDEDAPPASAPPPGAPAPPPGVQPLVHAGKMVFRPGVDRLEDGEALVCDESAYDLLHRMTTEWPALSFDFVCCDKDGRYCNKDPVSQATYPVSVMAVAGTQAEPGKQNKLTVMKLSNLHRTRKKRRSGGEGHDSEESDSEQSESEEEREEDATALDGILQNIDIKFESVVNRVRVMPQRSNIVAVWGESGRVSLVDVAPALDALNRDSLRRMSLPVRDGGAGPGVRPGAVKPFMSFAGHKDEGYALDWSRVVEGRLVSGANNGGIYAWDMADGGERWTVSPDRFRGHKGSVEDLQWSPNERNVFASCSSDRSICFWDTRQYRKPAAKIPAAHDGDVNVISWNANETHLVVSGGDDGAVKVWDLRAIGNEGEGKGISAAADFRQHKQPVTSVEWHPRDASMVAASSEDGCVTIWDLAVERDAEEELREGVVVAGADEYPPQLLFIHMGQRNTKELHWHPGVNSLLGSTAEDGINYFKPANISLPVDQVSGAADK